MSAPCVLWEKISSQWHNQAAFDPPLWGGVFIQDRIPSVDKGMYPLIQGKKAEERIKMEIVYLGIVFLIIIGVLAFGRLRVNGKTPPG